MGERLKCKQDWRHHAITLCFLFKLMKDYIYREELHALQNISCSPSLSFCASLLKEERNGNNLSASMFMLHVASLINVVSMQ